MDSNSKASSFSFLIFLVLFHVFCSTCFAFNITKLLSNYPDFKTFNKLLSDTGLAQQINTRQTITVLAVPNDGTGDVSGKPMDVAKNILGSHVILDYYDQDKLNKLQNKSSTLTTLFQTTGNANGQQGFIKVSKTSKGIMFGSAAKGAPLTATLVGVVAAQPYNISILRVSAFIETPGIESVAPPPKAGAPKKAPTPAAAPKKAKSNKNKKNAKSPAPTPVEAEAPTEAEAPGPVSSDAPKSDTPVSSPPNSETEAPLGETPAASPLSSGSSRTLVGSAVVVMACIMAL